MSTRIIALVFAGALLAPNSTFAIDANNNGMSDLWEALYAVSADAASQDYDGDGFTNQKESLLGTDPRDPRSRPTIEFIWDNHENDPRLRVETVIGKLYQIETSSDLLSWASLSPVFPGTDGLFDVLTTVPGESVTAGFFRNRFVADVDEDVDRLTAWEENYLGTRDIDSDTDDDGMLDGWEFQYGLDPLSDDAGADPDGDGLTNLQESQQGTDPTDRWNGVPPDYSIPPATPSEVVANTISPGNIEVTWKANSNNATAFYIERSSYGGQWTRVGTANGGAAISFMDTTAVPAVAYLYRVIAHN